jgi:ubiquinone/menaquinone biosynthesis C-methylase UbiE/DNA-binding transcriptional ArsR family regulator
MKLASGQIVEVLRAAGEPSRLRILALLAREELAVLELGRVLDQSQPRVSRHLKLLAEAGLVERFPDGAWVFYRLAGAGRSRDLVDQVLSHLDPEDEVLARDRARLDGVQGERAALAQSYFAENASRWDEIRSLYVSDTAVEEVILRVSGERRIRRLVDLGSGTGRMLTLLAPRATRALGLDLSQHMLNIARRNVVQAGLANIELRHGDILDTRLPDAEADLVVVHQVLHYLRDPAAAVREAARLVAPDGRLLIVDFAPHTHEFLREQHQHRRLGFTDEEMARWLMEAGLPFLTGDDLPPDLVDGLTVKIWAASRSPLEQRIAA